ASSALAAEATDKVVSVRIDEPELCPRYVARVIRGVKVGPSPAWLRSTLEKVGLRSVNNVVDVTNFVMLETGHPLHAFDLHLLGGGKIIVRRAAEGEKFVTLDGKERPLTNEMLLIADETKGVALAGIMGGKNSEIADTTADVLLESACFKPQNIRATSKKLDLRTDSSYRFERGADVGICDWASSRAAQLILETAGGSLLNPDVDAYPAPAAPRQVKLRPEKTNALLGIEIPAESQFDFLKRLGMESVEPGSAIFRVPTFRVDIKREADLIEEIGRLYGVDKIPSTPPRGAIGTNAYDTVHDELAEARRVLCGLGLMEAQGQTLISELRDRPGQAALQNPLSADMNVLRPSLLPGLLDSLRHNLARKNEDVAFFEIGRVFAQGESGFKEERRLAIAMTGRRNAAFWSGTERDAKFDMYDLKGILEEFFEQFGLRGFSFVRATEGNLFYVESASIQLGKLALGEMGQLSPVLGKEYDLRDAVLVTELNLDLTLSRRNAGKSFKPLPLYPSIRRDVAMLLPAATLHEAVLNVVRQAKPQNLEKTELFDVFRGKNVPEGHKSMAYAFTYRNPDRTLTDNEVNAAHQKLVEQLHRSLSATIRDA
ncbi:MAG TPA: phenylalanine--tRNA ligase subunit beta, partial [Verrucomicrobiae bacterium]